MDRQAAALFGRIVAVGLGPAVWLGGMLLRAVAGQPGPGKIDQRPGYALADPVVAARDARATPFPGYGFRRAP